MAASMLNIMRNESIVAGATVPVSVAVLHGNLIRFQPTLNALPSACAVCATESQYAVVKSLPHLPVAELKLASAAAVGICTHQNSSATSSSSVRSIAVVFIKLTPSPVAAKSNSTEEFPEILYKVCNLNPEAVATTAHVPLAVSESAPSIKIGERPRQFTRMNFVPSEPSIDTCLSVRAFFRSNGSANLREAASKCVRFPWGRKSIIQPKSEGKG